MHPVVVHVFLVHKTSLLKFFFLSLHLSACLSLSDSVDVLSGASLARTHCTDLAVIFLISSSTHVDPRWTGAGMSNATLTDEPLGTRSERKDFPAWTLHRCWGA